MSKLQSIVLGAGLVLFCLLYFGFSPKPTKIANLESKRAVASEVTDINNLIRDVQDELTSDQRSYLITLEKEIESSENESNKIELLKRLSGKWFEYRQPHIAGFYAEKIAETENTVEAWSIAGTTYSIGIQRTPAGKVRDFCTDGAVKAFENAGVLTVLGKPLDLDKLDEVIRGNIIYLFNCFISLTNILFLICRNT